MYWKNNVQFTWWLAGFWLEESQCKSRSDHDWLHVSNYVTWPCCKTRFYIGHKFYFLLFTSNKSCSLIWLFYFLGTFARIYEGVLTGPEEHQQQSVLVKTVSEIASSEQVNLMLIESSMLRDLTHKNLMPIMSVCLEDEKQPLVMFPFMNRGNLKLFLKKSRSPEGLSKVRNKGCLPCMQHLGKHHIVYLAI